MDNYLRIMEKLYNLREYLEKTTNEQQHRKIYLALLYVEEQGGIAQCDECREYYNVVNESNGLCNYCFIKK